MKRLIYIVPLLLVCIACTHKLEPTLTNTPRGNVQALWKIIDEKYCYINEKNIDWGAIGEEYLQRADTIKASDYRGLFAILSGMLDSLHDAHVNLYSSFDISATSIQDSFPVNFSSSLLFSKYLTNYQRAGALIYDRVANDSIGYIYLSSFNSSFLKVNMSYVLAYFKQCKGVIVDVRSNGGGDLDKAFLLASTFFSEERVVGYSQHKTGTAHDAFSDLVEQKISAHDLGEWTRPVVVLTNRGSYSATNFFVSAMRYADDCVLLGGRTGGGGGLPLSYELPNGWLVRLSSVKMYDAEKRSIEEGIVPNIQVNLTSTDKDDLVEAAIAYIQSK